LIIIPGMGINILFAYSIVQGTELNFQEGLAVVLVASIVFLITAFSRFGIVLKDAVPDSLKHVITAGLGFFIILIGLEKSHLVVKVEHSILAIGDFTLMNFIVGLITLFIAIFLYVKNIPANFLITLLFGTILAYFFGSLDSSNSVSSLEINNFLFTPSFTSMNLLSFWLSVFPLSIILIFENMGLLTGQLKMLEKNNQYETAYKVTAFSTLSCAFF